MRFDPTSSLPTRRRYGWRRCDLTARQLLLALTALASAVGCNGGISHELTGVWVGAPESSEAREIRESRRYAAELGVDAPSTSTPSDQSVSPDAEQVGAGRQTDWENYDVRVRLNFTGGNTVEMSLGEGSQPLVGQWRVVESAPGMVVVEITTPTADADANGTSGPIRRRFELQPDRRDGALVGFTLTEVGADLQLGWLYFTRPGAK